MNEEPIHDDTRSAAGRFCRSGEGDQADGINAYLTEADAKFDAEHFERLYGFKSVPVRVK